MKSFEPKHTHQIYGKCIDVISLVTVSIFCSINSSLRFFCGLKAFECSSILEPILVKTVVCVLIMKRKLKQFHQYKQRDHDTLDIQVLTCDKPQKGSGVKSFNDI